VALLLWPKDLAGQRYVVPVVPVLLVGLASVKVSRRWLSPALVYVAICLVSLGIRWGEGRFIPVGYQQYWTLAGELRGAPKNTVILCRKSNTMHLLSGKTAHLFPYDTNDQRVMAWIEGLGSSGNPVILVMDQLGYPQAERFLRPVIDAYPDRFSHRGSMGVEGNDRAPKTELWQYVNWK